MKTILFPLAFLVTNLIPLWAAAADATTCQETVERRANVQLQVLYSATGNYCFLTVTPLKKPTMIYRDYLMSDDGVLLVFNSFGSGPENDNTGAREFYFFPRFLPNPMYVWNDSARRLEVIHTNGDTFYFDYDTADIKAMGRGQVVVDSEVKKSNRGGVEILNYKGLVLDAGFAIGHAPTAKPSGPAVFKDQNGTECRLKNRDVFVTTGSDDVRFKYNDQALPSFIENRCPQLVYP